MDTFAFHVPVVVAVYCTTSGLALVPLAKATVVPAGFLRNRLRSALALSQSSWMYSVFGTVVTWNECDLNDPDVELPEPTLVLPLYESPPGQLQEDAEAARRVIECADVQELLAAVREPLTAGRFLDNVLAAPRLTRLEIPSDPNEAERLLC